MKRLEIEIACLIRLKWQRPDLIQKILFLSLSERSMAFIGASPIQFIIILINLNLSLINSIYYMRRNAENRNIQTLRQFKPRIL